MGITSLINPTGSMTSLKEADEVISGDGLGDMLKSNYDSNNDGVIDTVEIADAGTF